MKQDSDSMVGKTAWPTPRIQATVVDSRNWFWPGGSGARGSQIVSGLWPVTDVFKVK